MGGKNLPKCSVLCAKVHEIRWRYPFCSQSFQVRSAEIHTCSTDKREVRYWVFYSLGGYLLGPGATLCDWSPLESFRSAVLPRRVPVGDEWSHMGPCVHELNPKPLEAFLNLSTGFSGT